MSKEILEFTDYDTSTDIFTANVTVGDVVSTRLIDAQELYESSEAELLVTNTDIANVLCSAFEAHEESAPGDCPSHLVGKIFTHK